MKTLPRTLALIAALCCFSAQAEWTLVSKTDRMTNEVSHGATVRSNTLSLKPPFDGPVHGVLSLGWMQRGTGVSVAVSKGMINCSQQCIVTVRFDDAPPMKLVANPSWNGSYDTVYLEDKVAFLNAVRGARQILVSLPMIQMARRFLSSCRSNRLGSKPRSDN
jgi:hypothetical protein